jgi:light-regulated signal transduction histidine kinase (bacteriophytochrome)
MPGNLPPKQTKPASRFGTIAKDWKTAYYITDDQAGFNPVYADKLFFPFRQLHSDSEVEGTGIALAMVERIISLHGGKAWVEG